MIGEFGLMVIIGTVLHTPSGGPLAISRNLRELGVLHLQDLEEGFQVFPVLDRCGPSCQLTLSPITDRLRSDLSARSRGQIFRDGVVG